jgi:hypothetical protein
MIDLYFAKALLRTGEQSIMRKQSAQYAAGSQEHMQPMPVVGQVYACHMPKVSGLVSAQPLEGYIFLSVERNRGHK